MVDPAISTIFSVEVEKRAPHSARKFSAQVSFDVSVGS
jgi:hypothetical protein